MPDGEIKTKELPVLYSGIRKIVYFACEFDRFPPELRRAINQAGENVALQTGLNIVKRSVCNYGKGSKTVLYFLSESHMMVMLSKKEKFVEVELATCREVEGLTNRFLAGLGGLTDLKWKMIVSDLASKTLRSYCHGLV